MISRILKNPYCLDTPYGESDGEDLEKMSRFNEKLAHFILLMQVPLEDAKKKG